jgi:hypothetical protein
LAYSHWVSPAFGQTITTADALGVVTDSSGAVVPGATVSLRSVDSGESRTDTTNGQGQYRFALLKPGNYTMSADAKGLKSNISNVNLLVGQAAEVNLIMNPQGTATVVEVSASAAVLQTENANVETNFTKTQVDQLPMPGGDLSKNMLTDRPSSSPAPAQLQSMLP